jgi:hypothetical protein
MKFVVGKLTLGQVLLITLRFPFVSVIPPTLRTPIHLNANSVEKDKCAKPVNNEIKKKCSFGYREPYLRTIVSHCFVSLQGVKLKKIKSSLLRE